MTFPILFLNVFILIFLSGCTNLSEKKLVLEKVSYQELSNFENDNFEHAFPALKKSCERILKNPNKTYLRGEKKSLMKDWMPFCKCILTMENPSSHTLKKTIKTYLTPYRAKSSDGENEGLFTGYYEPLLRGSLKKQGRFQTPLYKKPSGVLSTLSRSQIINGGLKNRGLEIVYVDDPADAFFLQIQGSGRVQLENGTIIRLAYDGGNKRPYTPIGKTLIDRGYFVKGRDIISMQTIKQWLRNNPLKAEEIMSANESYVFFKISNENEGPKGAHGVPLTTRRSIAIDPSHISYGTPLWVDLYDPNLKNIEHLMVAQDTGGAIKGPLRGDYFWGFGDHAAEKAGVMNAKGVYYLLLPK